MKRVGAGVGAALLLAVALPESGKAATIVGSDLAANPAQSYACACTVAIASAGTGAAAGGSTVPSPGVLTSFRLKTGAFQQAAAAKFRVLRGNTGAGTSAPVNLMGVAAVQQFPIRLPVQAGDKIGIDPAAGNYDFGNYFNSSVTGANLPLWNPALTDGETRAPGPLGGALLLNATLESDADGDGFGDETQDGCPTSAASQGVCPPPPETAFLKSPKKKLTKSSATFSFISDTPGATFECKIDDVGLGYATCSSPTTLKGLKKGKHVFSVRAVANGIPDPTPAEAKFQIKKKKRKK